MELSSRMKDYYDIYFLANSYGFAASNLQDALSQTLKNRDTQYDSDTLKNVRRFLDDKEMNRKWSHFAKGTLGIDLEFKEVLDTIYYFIQPIFMSIINEGEVIGTWNPQNNTYEVV